ncbi:MAG TPA: hypothetical protein VFN36_05780 [Solirubrobacteraceae bacterium]|nr:hypothetical protein [Solirubrobacteraceae bacterium]
MQRARSFLVGLVIAAPFYWLLIDTTTSPELITGGVVAVLTATTTAAAYLESTLNAAVRLRWLAQGWRELARVPAGVGIVCREVLAQTVRPRPCRGAIEADPFATRGDDAAHQMGRRALAETLRTLAPHTIAIGVDPESHRLLQHRLGGSR